jgi:uncharacterized protein
MQVYGEDSYEPQKEKEKAAKAAGITSLQCLILFLVSYLGLIVVSYIFTSIFSVSGLLKSGMEKTSPEIYYRNYAYLELVSYGTLGILMVSLVYYFNKDLFKTHLKAMGNGQFWLHILMYLGIIYVASLAWSIIDNAIINALKIQNPVNENQSLVNSMMTYNPAATIFPVVLIAPITEELGYRQGLFELISRKSKVWAYVVSIVFFGLIHVASALIGGAIEHTLTSTTVAIELLSLPSYMIGGAVFAYVYDKEGNVVVDITAHASYNAIALLMTFISKNLSEGTSSSAAALFSFWPF